MKTDNSALIQNGFERCLIGRMYVYPVIYLTKTTIPSLRKRLPLKSRMNRYQS